MEKRRKEGVDAQIDLDEHHGGPTDPTGHVSSGLQGGPLREKGGRPVADVDEAEPPSTRRRDLEEQNVDAEELRGGSEASRGGDRKP